MDHQAFIYDQGRLAEFADFAIDHARSLGAKDAVVRINEGATLTVSARNGSLDTMQHSREKRMDITVFVGDSHGASYSSDLSLDALKAATDAAFHIASYTAADPCAGPVDAESWPSAIPDLDLFHHWPLTVERAVEIAAEVEAASRDLVANGASAGVTLDNGQAVLDSWEGQFILATSRGFSAGYSTSRHYLDCEIIASNAGGMQVGSWSSGARAPEDLESALSIGRAAARRAIERLDARCIPTAASPILFDAPVAHSLLRALLDAIGGKAQYQQRSSLLNSLGTTVLPPHVSVTEQPHRPRGEASAPFDSQGVATVDRFLVRDGLLETYLLDSYAARKLGLPLTGHAGGARNVTITSSETAESDDTAAMLRKLDTGLMVTELLGGNIDPVTGDYSYGVSGLKIEKGEIAHAVEDITIAGNLQTMLKGIVAIGADRLTRGSVSSGSILIDRMQIAGL